MSQEPWGKACKEAGLSWMPCGQYFEGKEIVTGEGEREDGSNGTRKKRLSWKTGRFGFHVFHLCNN